jgi:hypothetical protein
MCRTVCRSHWPRGRWRGSAAARLLGLRVRIPPEGMDVCCCECCALSGRGLCDGLITRPGEFYRLGVSVWSWSLDKEESLTHWGPLGHGKKESYVCKVVDFLDTVYTRNIIIIIIIITIIIIIIIYCNWVVTRWQWLVYMYTEYEIGY